MLEQLFAAVLLWVAVATGGSDGRQQFDLSFTTSPVGGKYAPRHVAAVWVEDSEGRFIRTLGRWGTSRAYNLAQWDAADGTDIDGITGATPREHGHREVSWNLRDRHGLVVPDGIYTIRLELTDHNKNRNMFQRASIPFHKDGLGRRWQVDPQDGFSEIALAYTVGSSETPVVANLRPAKLGESTATLRGRVTDGGGENPRARLFWGDEDGGTDAGSWQHELDLGVVGEAEFRAEVRDLVAGKACFYRCYVENSILGVWAGPSVRFVPCASRVAIAVGASWRYFEGREFPGDGWRDPEFDDQAWSEGPTGIGFGDDDDATVLESMRRSFVTVYLRKEFRIGDPSKVQALEFTVDYDDGFVAFLNGTEVARRNVPAEQTHLTSALGNREAGEPETIDLFAWVGALRAEANVLAIEVHNKGAKSSDLSMLPSLVVWEVGAGAGG